MTTAVPILERGLTAVALNDYIKSEPRIAEVDGTLAAGVDGDLLIDVIKDRGSPDAHALVLFFHGEAVNIGLLGKLAMKLHLFAKQEDEGPKLKKQKHKAQLDERKLDKLLAAQKKEHEARVSEETGGLLFEANVAKAELKLNARDAELEAKFLAESVEFKVTLPEHLQAHFKYAKDNLEAVLLDMAGTDDSGASLPGGKVIKPFERVRKRGKGSEGRQVRAQVRGVGARSGARRRQGVRRARVAAAEGATHLLPAAACTTRAEERRREGRVAAHGAPCFGM